MRRERYVYNKQTLRYETVVEPLSTTLLRVFGFVCAAVLTAVAFAGLIYNYLPSPKEKALQAKVERLEAFIENDAGKNLEHLEKVAENLNRRDAEVHRVVFGMTPIDENVWNGGIGGHDAYAEFENLGKSGELMAGVKERVDRLKHQLNLQSHSLDTLLNLAKNKEELLACMPTIKPVRRDMLSRRVGLLSGFGRRMHPVFKVMKMHNGIDFTAGSGTPIIATGKGKVIRAQRAGGFGNLVVIDHGFGYQSYYAHMSKIKVKVGEKVERGHEIGLVGSTGTSTAPHCHYEVHYQGRAVNPLSFVMDGLSPEEYKALTEAASVVNQSLH